jgi:hypothetical protein
VSELAHAGMRGVIAAMAMTGMRAFTVSLGLVQESPPRAIMRKRAHGLLRVLPRKRRRAAIEGVHWTYGAGGGLLFGALPDEVRRRAWAGPLYGLALWLGFELALAPALGLEHAKKRRLAERAALAADHAVYGLVLSDTRRRPRR